MKVHKFISMARRLALTHDFDEELSHRLCAVVVKGGSVVSVGFNKKAANSFVEECLRLGGDHVPDRRKPFVNTHAEADAILKAHTLYVHRDPRLRKEKLSGAKVYVARIARDTSLGLARPCLMCENMLYRYGVRRVTYSIDDVSYGVMTIMDAGDTKDEVVT